MKEIKLFAFLMVLAFSQSMLCQAQDFIQITQNGVNIRFSPSTSSTVITQGKEGNIFELQGEKGSWYQINMFSGEYRYVYKSLCKRIEYTIQLPESESFRKKVFMAVLAAEDRAFTQSISKYPNDFNKQIDYQRILEDKYKLSAMNSYNAQPPIYTKLIVEGAKKGWVK